MVGSIPIPDQSSFLSVTDYERKFVLGVATSQDLEVRLFYYLCLEETYEPLIRSRFATGVRLAARHLISISQI